MRHHVPLKQKEEKKKEKHSDISMLKAAGLPEPRGDALTSLTAVSHWVKCSPEVMLTH